jgi:hypothetical protein
MRLEPSRASLAGSAIDPKNESSISIMLREGAVLVPMDVYN